MLLFTDGTTYHFGSLAGGLVIYSFPTPRPDSEDDRLAFGFITRQSNCVIMRLVSGNSEDHLLIAIMVSTNWCTHFLVFDCSNRSTTCTSSLIFS